MQFHTTQLHTSIPNNMPLFGILGGMGPFASAAFLNSIYRCCIGKFSIEQNYPRIIIVSDPNIPDRTSAIKNNKHTDIIRAIENKIILLNKIGVSHIIVACITAHLYLDMIQKEVKTKVINLVDLLNKTLDQQHYRSLLLSSRGSYDLNIIQHPNVIYPESKDADVINQLIYKIKLHNSKKEFLEFIDFSLMLAEKYQTESLLFGCTELHLVHSFIQQYEISLPYAILDPLEISARALVDLHLAYLDTPIYSAAWDFRHSANTQQSLLLAS